MEGVNMERKRRIRVALAAYMYEIKDDPIMTDAEYDSLSYSINPEEETGNPLLDKFFREEFQPCTGQWIYNHPDISGIMTIEARYFR